MPPAESDRPDLGLPADSAHWYDIWGRLPPAATPAPVPSPAETVELLTRMGVNDTQAAAAAAARPDPDRDWQLWWVIERCYRQLNATMGEVGMLMWPALPDRFGAPGRFTYLYALLAAIPRTLDFYRRHGIDEEVFWATFSNVAEKLHLNETRFGHQGLKLAFWFTLHTRGALFRLGRLEFAMERLSDTHPFAGQPPGKMTLGIHIPGEAGPMDIASCTDSIKRARAFFPTHFGPRFDGTCLFTCTSWLLDPQLREFLPAQSNIVRFQDLFTLEPPAENATTNGRKDVLQFVFDRTGEMDLETLPRDTSLRRHLADGWVNGRQWQVRSGWLR